MMSRQQSPFQGRREFLGYMVDTEGEIVRAHNWRNIFKKWFTDRITLGALFNTVAFLVIINVQGEGRGRDWDTLEEVEYISPNLSCLLVVRLP
jgi:hypothetical protein